MFWTDSNFLHFKRIQSHTINGETDVEWTSVHGTLGSAFRLNDGETITLTVQFLLYDGTEWVLVDTLSATFTGDFYY